MLTLLIKNAEYIVLNYAIQFIPINDSIINNQLKKAVTYRSIT